MLRRKVERSVCMFKCFKRQCSKALRQLQLYVLCRYESLVGKGCVKYERLTWAQIVGGYSRRCRQLNHRHGHVGFKLYGRFYSVFVLNLCFFHVPVNSYGLEAQVDRLSCFLARTYKNVVAVRVMPVGRYAYCIVSFGQCGGKQSVAIGQSLGYHCSCCRMLHYHLSSAYMRSFSRVVCVLVAYVYD